MAIKTPQTTSKLILPRRQLLMAGVAVSAGALAPTKVLAGINGTMCVPSGGGYGSGAAPYDDAYDEDFGDVPIDGPGERRVRIRNPRNGEIYDHVYVQSGQYVQSALDAYDWFARDWRHNKSKKMDPGLLDIIWKLSQMLGVNAPFSLTSGYRNPTSNTTVGGRKRSYHLRGKANDLQHPERSPRVIYAAAMKIGSGGVGRYRSFTHIDTGPTRTWRG
jgi:uncharacterized protein YcbK (DUF882 family)